MKRLDSLGYDESELLKGVKRLTGSHATTPEQYRELSQFAGQRLALGMESFKSAKDVLRALHSYFVQFENPRTSPAMAENSTKALLKVILYHIVLQEKKDILKAAFNDLAKAIDSSKFLGTSNESRVMVKDLRSLVRSWTPSFFGGGEAELVDLMPFPIREAIKTIIEGLGPIRISATVTVNPDDIFVSQAGMVREGVAFPTLKPGNLVTRGIDEGKVPRVELAGPAKILYDSFSNERVFNTIPHGERLGSVSGFSLPAAAAAAASHQKARTRKLKDALGGMSKYASRFVEEKRGSAPAAAAAAAQAVRAQPYVPSLENMRPPAAPAASLTRKRGRALSMVEEENSSQSQRRKISAAGVGLNGSKSRSKSRNTRRRA
jgi:hypothetical protein